MAKIVINQKDVTISEMRRNLGRVLSKLDGGSKCSFSLTVLLPKPTIPNFPKGD